jgi:hypothetical protein
MTATPLADKLAELKVTEAEAWAKVKDAMAKVLQGDRRADLIQPFWERPDRATPEDLRRWTADLIAQVQEEGLVFELSREGNRALTVVDPALREAVTEARETHFAAQSERQTFEKTNALQTEQKKAQADRFKSALDEGDIDGVREALNPSGREDRSLDRDGAVISRRTVAGSSSR